MVNDSLPDGHEWIMRREVKIGGQTFFHRQCRRCWRDFVTLPDLKEWIAVHVGVFTFDFLDDEINRKWLSESCPGRQLPDELNDIRSFGRRKSSKADTDQ